MISFFKRESDIHEKSEEEEVFDANEEVEVEEDDEEIGVLVHFTPVATFLYINRDGFMESNRGLYELQDMEGYPIDLQGNIMVKKIEGMHKLPKFISDYQLEQPRIPLVKIEVEDYEG